MKAKMKFERTKSMTYYYCPICMLNSTNKAEIEKHFREGHQVKVKKNTYIAIFAEKVGMYRHLEKRAPESEQSNAAKAILIMGKQIRKLA